ncbi:hypothetical protein [Streptomyces sp. NPDC051776]|uniref:hypothetical protein n=1 Tax=Streptomyces sp. NPDC051776 TaxID=3155414 RepID=UPI003425DCF9
MSLRFRTSTVVALAAAVALFASSCGDGHDASATPTASPDRPSSAGSSRAASSPSAGQPGPSASGAPSPSPTVSQDRKVPAPVLVEMVVTGGFAGRQEQLRVLEDGTYTTVNKGKTGPGGTVEASGLRSLRQALSSADFPNLPRRTINEQARDMIQYVVVHDHVTVMTDQSEPVAGLDRVISMLSPYLPGRSR